MRKHALFVLFCFILFIPLVHASKRPTLQWVAHYKGPGNNRGYPLALAVDNSSNIYVTGTSQSLGVGFSADGGKDYATIKYDRNGKQLWVARYDGPGVNGPYNNGEDEAYAIAVDHVGNVYVTGHSKSEYDDSDCATIKYNSEGKQLWVARSSYGSGLAIAVDDSGNTYVAVSKKVVTNRPKYTTIKYDPNGKNLWARHREYNYRGMLTGPKDIVFDDSGDVYVNGLDPIKYKPNGDQVWAKSFGEFLRVEDTNSFYYMRSIHNSTTDLDSELSKYDNNGKKLWSARYSGSANAYDCLELLGADRFGNVYWAGNSMSKGTDLDCVTIKFDCNGNKLWTAHYNGPANGSDLVDSIVVDDLGNVYLAGSSKRVDSHDDLDVIVLKYDYNGKELWCVRYGGNFGTFRALAIDDFGNFYITGSGEYHSGEYITIKYAQQK